MKDEYIESLASDLLSRYRGQVSLLKAFEAAAKGDVLAERVAVSLRLSGSADRSLLKLAGNERLSELLGLVISGVESGANLRKAIALFRNRLRSEIRMRNRFKAKAGSSLTLTHMGMCFFFPFFSSISSIILRSTAGLESSGIGITGQGFMLASILYVFITLYLTSAFAHPVKSALENLFAISPYFFFSLAVTLITQNFLSGLL